MKKECALTVSEEIRAPSLISTKLKVAKNMCELLISFALGRPHSHQEGLKRLPFEKKEMLVDTFSRQRVL
jgi:hypothetical protein